VLCPAPVLTAADVADVLATIVPRVRRLLERRGLGDGDEGASAVDEWAEDAPVLAGLAGASVQGTFALGPRAGKRARPCGAVPVEDQDLGEKGFKSDRCHARQEGFDLDVGIGVPADQRDRLERLCRLCGAPHNRQLTSRAEGERRLLSCFVDGPLSATWGAIRPIPRRTSAPGEPRCRLPLCVVWARGTRWPDASADGPRADDESL